MREMKQSSLACRVAPPATLLICALTLAGCGESRDPGAEFAASLLDSPTAPGSLSPHLASTTDGRTVMSWLEPTAGGAHAVKYSMLDGQRWSDPKIVAESDGWFVNWADFPSVVPVTEEHWVAHWLVKRPGGTYSYDIAMSISDDGGTRWRAPLTPHSDGTPTEHGFISIFPWSGDIGAVWLDGRNMAPDVPDAQAREGVAAYGGMTLRFARLAYDGEIHEDGEIDALVCECCQTDVAMTERGPVVAYRDRTPEEIRDISVARYVDDGWTTPVTISDDDWNIPACPVNGPALAADGDAVIVAWYAAPKRDSRIKVAWSADSGATFSAPIVVDASDVGGRVDVELLTDGSAVVSWVGRTGDGGAELRMRSVTPAGEQGPVRVVAEGPYARNAGFPQMVRSGDRLVYAWPEPGEPRRVLTALSPLGDD
jgi:hypothetical protein